MSPDATPGRLFAGTCGTALLRFALPPSLPIPLRIAAPAGLSLATWAFAGLEEGAPGGPVCLLALEGRLDGDVTVSTHFRDLSVRPEPAPAEAPDEAERILLARALLSAGTGGMAALKGLFPLVEAAVTILPVAGDAPALIPDGPGYALTGTAIPHGLLVRSPAGWGCARVAAGRLGFAGGPRIGLRLDPLWGAAPARVQAAVALHAHAFTPLAVRSA